jgi:hypothetical protein
MSSNSQSILIIDDVEVISASLKSKLGDFGLPFNIEIYTVEAQKAKEEIVKEVVNLIQSKNVVHIISDRGFVIVKDNVEQSYIQKESDGITLQRVDDIVKDVVTKLEDDILSSIRSFTIYSYDPFSLSIRRDFRELRNKLSLLFAQKLKNRHDSKSHFFIKTIETSSIYRRPGKTGIYPNGFHDSCLIGSYQNCVNYGFFLADVLHDVIRHNEIIIDRINPYSYSKFQNYEMLKHIRSLEDLIESNTLRIGSVSCFGNLFGVDEYLVDVPYKSYYPEINAEILRVDDHTGKVDLSQIFYINQNKEKGFSQREYILFNYSVFENDEITLNQDLIVSDGLKCCKTVCESWLPLLHSSIFFCENDTWKNKLQEKSKITGKQKVCDIKLFFAISELNEDDFDGTFNFTLFSYDNELNHTDIELKAFEKYAPLIESKLLELILPYKTKETTKQATRAAISQVMARNMSHNIGSHVLSKFKNKSDIESIKQLQGEPFGQYKGALPTLEINKQIANFNDYLKSRMDFLADITMATPILETPYKFSSDVVQGLLNNPILLDRISGISGDVSYTFKVYQNKVNQERFHDLYEGNKWEYDSYTVSMPNDILGCHAFYIIVENIIRNTFKHSKSDIKHFEFNIDIQPCEDDPDLYEVRLYDNNCKPIHELTPVIESRNKAFNDDIIKDNKLRSDSLGTIEMEVCAAYLRKISLDDYQDDIYTVNKEGFNEDSFEKKIKNIIRAYPQYWNEQCDCASLGYVFYLLKPKEVLIVSKNAIIEQNGWRNDGIDVVKELDKAKTYAHQIILTDQDIESSISITSRIVKLQESEISDLSSKDSKTVIEYAWEKYGAILLKNEPGFRFLGNGKNFTYPSGKENEEEIQVNFPNHDGGNSKNEYIRASHHKYIKLFDSDEISKEYLVSLSEMVKTKVCIIDERIQVFAGEKKYINGIAFIDYYKHINVHIPKIKRKGAITDIPDPNLNAPNFGSADNSNSEQYKLKAYLEKHKDSDFIILHLGIIEKMLVSKKSTDVEAKIRELVNSCEEKYSKIILTSGRGTPDTVPENCRYLPLSAVQHCVETTFDKFLLVKALYNARKTK